jgi:hypothetical protein
MTKSILCGFLKKRDRPTPFAGAMNRDLFRGFLPERCSAKASDDVEDY